MRIRKVVNISLSPTIEAEIRQRAQATELPISTLMEDAWRYFKGEPTPLSTARRAMVFPDSAKPVKRAA